MEETTLNTIQLSRHQKNAWRSAMLQKDVMQLSGPNQALLLMDAG